MSTFRLVVTAVVAGAVGAVAGAFIGGFLAAATCEGGLECLGNAILGVGSGTILLESAAMSLAVHTANGRRGSLPLTGLATLALAVPVPFLLLLGYAAVLAAPVLAAQIWLCIKVQRATGKSGRRRRKR